MTTTTSCAILLDQPWHDDLQLDVGWDFFDDLGLMSDVALCVGVRLGELGSDMFRLGYIGVGYRACFLRI